MALIPKPNLANARLDPDVVNRITKVFSLTASSNDGEGLAAVRMLYRVLQANGIDQHVLIARMKNSWLSDEHKEVFTKKVDEARIAGRAEGAREVEAKRGHEVGFSNTDQSTDWRAVARYVSRERHRLPWRNQDAKTFEFINGMVALAQSPSTSLSQGRANWLFDLLAKLGGRVT
jgi:hypothetical protein